MGILEPSTFPAARSSSIFVTPFPSVTAHRHPDRTRLALSGIGIDRGDTRRLGETVALEDADPEATLERLEQLP